MARSQLHMSAVLLTADMDEHRKIPDTSPPVSPLSNCAGVANRWA